MIDNFVDQNPNEVLVFGPNGKSVRARTANQKKMVQSADKNDIVFAIGPTGTDKTYTAVALAVRALKNKLVKKLYKGLCFRKITIQTRTKNNLKSYAYKRSESLYIVTGKQIGRAHV